jgi:hypothetical protein
MKRPCQALAGRRVVDHLMSVSASVLRAVRLPARGWRFRRYGCVRLAAGRAGRRGRPGPARGFLPGGPQWSPASRPARRAVAAGDAQQP